MNTHPIPLNFRKSAAFLQFSSHSSGFASVALWGTVFALVAGLVSTTFAEVPDTVRLKDMSLEELVNVEVTTLSKKPQMLSKTAAAVYVITSNEIARSGYTSIPQILRNVPGLQAAQIDGNQWAITSRGFAGAFSNKLLVLIDGRSVYSPLFSGVYWDVQDVLLEDIERIEVIRGSGGSLWGANAVNGIINIITKHARGTIGGLAQAGIGTHSQSLGAFRYGRVIRPDAALRLYAKYSENGTAEDTSGLRTADDMGIARGGLRFDHSINDRTALTLQGDVYSGQTGATYALPSAQPPYQLRFDDRTDVSGGNLLARISKTVSPESELSLQSYLDLANRKDIRVDDNQTTIDFDFNHRFRASRRLELTWGLGYRYTRSHLSNTEYVIVSPNLRSDNLWSGFAQSEVPLVSELLTFTLGSKVEHNDYTGFEYQPTARLSWTPRGSQAVWAAASRAIRTPSRIEHDGAVNWMTLPPLSLGNPSQIPLLLRFEGVRTFESEELISYEVGHRSTWLDRISSDIALFYNDYDNLLAGTNGAPIFDSTNPTYAVVPITANNSLKGHSYGLEWAVDWFASKTIVIRTGYSHLEVDMKSEDRMSSEPEREAGGGSPEDQFFLRFSHDDGRRFAAHASLRYVDRLPFQNLSSYWTMDARLGWTASRNLELSLVGQNLLDVHHVEFIPRLGTVPSEVSRGLYSTVRWVF